MPRPKVRTNLLKACGWSASAALLAVGPAVAADAPTGVLEEIVVTATKRKESVREISGSVSAVSDEQLEEIGAQGFADYVQRLPGVVFNDFQPGTSHVVIRGVATNSGNVQGQGTTGYYINDVPLTEPGWTIVIPDIDAFDVQRVEVLRGPQGSLFGAASMGGAVNYIANTADLGGLATRFEAGASQTRNSDLAYSAKAMVNLPLVADKLAARAVVTYRDQPGYLDNVGIGRKGSNDSAIGGGRLSVAYQPAESTKLSWLSLYQKTDVDDAPYRNPAVGEFARNTAIAEPNVTDVQVHSLRLDQDFSAGTLTAIGAYQKKSQEYVFDYTPYRIYYNADLALNLTTPLYIGSGGDSDGESIEVRFASRESERFNFVAGAMYFRSDKDLYEQLGAKGAAAAFDASPLYGPGSGAVIAPNGEIFNAYYTNVVGKESALFGEGSWKLTPQWKLTGGGRFYKNEVDSTSTQVGFSTYPGAPIVTPTSDEEDGFSPKVSLTYQPSDRFMSYVLYSEGFRFGTPNSQGLSAYPVPAGSKSDSLKNYELGVRTSWLDRSLFVDATLFYVDWTNIQLRLQTPDFFNYAANGGAADIKGIETSFAWQPMERLELQSNITYMEARLSEPLFILYYGTAPEGSQLPGSADWSISTTASYRFAGAWEPTLLISQRYLSGGISDLNSAVPGATPNLQGNYRIYDARLRGRIGNTAVTLFGANLTDDRGITRTVPEANGLSQGLVRPRTFGVTVEWEF